MVARFRTFPSFAPRAASLQVLVRRPRHNWSLLCGGKLSWQAFQELIKLPEKRPSLIVASVPLIFCLLWTSHVAFCTGCRRQQIRGVERVRSVEEWAEIAVTKADYSWHGFSTQGVMNDIRGKPVVFTKRGSMFDGWAEYFLLASPAELKSADILFAKPRSYM